MILMVYVRSNISYFAATFLLVVVEVGGIVTICGDFHFYVCIAKVKTVKY